jgi:hypothetical protein
MAIETISLNFSICSFSLWVHRSVKASAARGHISRCRAACFISAQLGVGGCLDPDIGNNSQSKIVNNSMDWFKGFFTGKSIIGW